MNRILSFAMAVCLINGLAGCRGRAPIQDVNQHIMPENAKTMTDRRIGEVITSALLKRKCYCTQVSDNKLTCSNDARRYQATVDIIYSKNDFSIHHVSTTNMKESEGKIHPKYNKWVASIKKDILKAIATSH